VLAKGSSRIKLAKIFIKQNKQTQWQKTYYWLLATSSRNLLPIRTPKTKNIKKKQN
jgi:hypothetical protein